VKFLHVVTHFDDVSDNLVARIGIFMIGESSGCDAKVPISIDQVQITSTYTGETIAYTHPIGAGQRLSRKILHLQGSKGRKIGSSPEATDELSGNDTSHAEFHG
jgi:hypothetical protein